MGLLLTLPYRMWFSSQCDELTVVLAKKVHNHLYADLTNNATNIDDTVHNVSVEPMGTEKDTQISIHVL